MIELDKVQVEYGQIEAITKARDEGIITSAEFDSLIAVRKNAIRKLLSLEPIE